MPKRRQITVADSETDPFKRGRVPMPFIWGFHVPETGEYEEFFDTKDFIEYVSGQEIICYAHNGGKFDWHYILKEIGPYEPMTVINGRLAKFKIGNCEFRDSFNIIPAPLAAYQKDVIDYAIFEPGEREKPENMERIRAYLKSDCIYLGEMVTEFINLYGMNLTQASASMKIWSKMSGIKRPKSSKYYYDEMSRYYYGGRVQCFELGIIEKPFQVIDIKSAYPFAMVHKHPWGMVYSLDDTLNGYSDDDISRSFITLKAASLGAFPLRTKHGLQFPADHEIREFHITGWEYLAARDTGTLKEAEILKVRHYAEHISFREYVEHFFAMKAEAEGMMNALGPNHPDFPKWAAQRLFAKIFLNSLYGKFASNPENYQEFMTLPGDMLEGAKEVDGWFFCKMASPEIAIVNRPLPEEKHNYFDVSVAASITGFVRAYLWRNICKCSGVLYCDTDSIAAEKIDVTISKKLGDWEIEAKCDFGAIGGKKLYAFRRQEGTFDAKKEKPWKVASKGVRLSPDQIIQIAQGEAILDIPEVPTFSVKRPAIFTPRKVKMLDAVTDFD